MWPLLRSIQTGRRPTRASMPVVADARVTGAREVSAAKALTDARARQALTTSAENEGFKNPQPLGSAETPKAYGWPKIRAM